MSIHKFVGSFKKPLNFNTNSPQGIEWMNATPETHPHYYGVAKYIFDDSTGFVYRNLEKHQTGVVHARIRGGKWEKIKMKRIPGTVCVESFCEMKVRLKLKSASFRGLPKLLFGIINENA